MSSIRLGGDCGEGGDGDGGGDGGEGGCGGGCDGCGGGVSDGDWLLWPEGWLMVV